VSTPFDELLARGRLVPTDDYTQADIDAGRERLAHRLAASSGSGNAPGEESGRPASAATDLVTLCEAVVAQPGGLDRLARALGPSCVLEPDGARVLGCVLALAAAQDSARFWWQYAAGAGDHPAAFCLSLYHEAHGETEEADWWHGQVDLPALASDSLPPTEELRLGLRVLRRLQEDRPFSKGVAAAIAYVPAAVGWVDDDLDLPLPDVDFIDRLKSLVFRDHVPRTGVAPLQTRAGRQNWPPVRRPSAVG
jgi:hypothetical protein